MITLGVNFGHDASLCLFENGRISGFRELERHSRYKHQVGITAQDIRGFLEACNVTMTQIDLIAVCGTQFYTARFSPEIKLEIVDQQKISSAEYTTNWYDYTSHKDRLGDFREAIFPNQVFDSLPFYDIDNLTGAARPKLEQTRDSLKKELKSGLVEYIFEFDRVTVPCFFVHHHWAHAAYAAYYFQDSSNFIVSHDGGWPHLPFNSGGIFLNKNGLVIPLCDPKLCLGQVYQQAGEWAGFRASEAPGKLMGLAAYGLPSNDFHILSNHLNSAMADGFTSADGFSGFLTKLRNILEKQEPCLIREHEFCDYPIDTPNSIKIAANVQRLVEEQWTSTLQKVALQASQIKEIAKEILIVGGFALNCPANTLADNSLCEFSLKTFPGCADTGISIGACQVLSSILDHSSSRGGTYALAAFEPINDIEPLNAKQNRKELELDSGTTIQLDSADVSVEIIAQLIVEGNLLCRIAGNSEIGPRALGNRSILAHALHDSTRDQINKKKNREDWRPLAPIVRSCDFHKFFLGDPRRCTFMLTAEKVRDSRLRAVTHVDNTARVQTVDGGFIWDLLTEIDKLGEIPVILNTSFNVAGEPLVETPEQAVASFLKMELDYLILEKDLYRRLN